MHTTDIIPLTLTVQRTKFVLKDHIWTPALLRQQSGNTVVHQLRVIDLKCA